MGKLTTHVLDLMHGVPAAGMHVRLLRLSAEGQPQLLKALRLNVDGRSEQPLLEDGAFIVGRYRLVFDVSGYFKSLGVALPEPAFLEEVPLDFGVSEESAHYHVPLLCSPWGYSTYRGS
jgi:5-hydroxyisourate hydrolase